MKTRINLLSVLILMVCILPLKNSGQDTLTIGEVYDFEVGNIFNYYESGYQEPLRVTWIEILDKYYNPEFTIEYYVRKISSWDWWPDFDTNYTQYFDTIHYTDLGNLMPEIDSIYADEAFYNGRTINLRDISQANITEYENYVEGCGLGYYLFYWMEGPTPVEVHELSLVYYKKDNEEWGTPIIVTIDEKPESQSHINVFPNPASSFITIQIQEGIPIEQVIIYNHLGQKVLETKPVNNTIDVSGLKAGMYMIEVYSKQEIKRTKLIVSKY